MLSGSSILLLLHLAGCLATNFRQYSKEDMVGYREEVRSMFQHAYDSYLRHAFPFDELRPLSCDGMDTWGSYSLTLIDALDTLAVMGNNTEFRRVYDIVAKRTDFDANINVSVFETNIRIVGGLLSAHLVARKAGVQLEPGWPCNGPLLALAEDVAKRLLPAFDTPTGMPYGTVNLRHGVPDGETPVTCTAGVGTFIVEFGALSRLTGNQVYEDTAMRAMRSLWHHQSNIGLVGNHIDILKGKWTAVEAGIGAGVDSYYEYLVKGAALLQRPELMQMFVKGRESVERYLTKDDWHFWANMKTGQVTMPVFQNLEAFWPGLLSMVGDNSAALKSLHNYHQVWKQYGFTPEFYNVAQGGVAAQREGYPLRPELIESVMYLHRATKDPWLVNVGVDILRSIQHSAWTPCGYATVKNVLTHQLDDRMESFFLAETTKYLYLLFDEDNFIHNPGTYADVIETPHGQCVVDAGGYIFNTEAHPIDPAALACCSGLSDKEIKEHIGSHMVDILNPHKFKEFRGDLVPERVKKIRMEREREEKERKEREIEINARFELMRKQAREEAANIKKEEEKHRARLREKNNVTAQDQDGDIDNAVFGEESVGKVETNNDTGYDSDVNQDNDDLKDEDLEKTTNDPEFSAQREPKDKTIEKDPKHNQEMIQKHSRGEMLEVESGSQIIQPEKMPDMFTQRTNRMLETLNNIIENFLPTKASGFDMEGFTSRLRSGEQYPINKTWESDFGLMSCPAQAFTDRFLIHGEFFDAES